MFLGFLRSRPSAAYRYDGYASDTAAFDVDTFIDEVDYRRPLHVQTPIRFVNQAFGRHQPLKQGIISQKPEDSFYPS